MQPSDLCLVLATTQSEIRIPIHSGQSDNKADTLAHVLQDYLQGCYIGIHT